ncbi:hypothetical protein EJ03DRAFT_110214 [Teratosphaeria nubilosa]|uniref:Uncharacterized protein n=1 Tax=Teratosphaeria nubilosa TaxID=161662 RepID=A0A6G1L7S1_9PEZI|nr:hypothetical protein EJ03DRAFT_110214 [Teratosphaeria nubilosa]
MAHADSTSTSGATTPLARSDSPSPDVSPSLALHAVPLLDRSVSTPSNSSGSTLSTRSRQSRSSDGASTVVRRRGYVRPQGTSFADSARNRDSVMSLGSIAHMQYYFARTGLLDGKGAQLMRDKDRDKDKKKRDSNKENWQPSMSGSALDELAASSLSVYEGTPFYAVSDPGQETGFVESPTDMVSNSDGWSTGNCGLPPMLPPTVSTYKQRPSYTEPLPDLPVLRRELKEALQDACKVIEESQKQQEGNSEDNAERNDAFYEIEGLHILDIITLAIRAAKNYYTAHSHPEKLYAIRSEKDIRGDLYQVLDILKRMASRNFRGGMKLMELAGIVMWIESIDKLLKKEEEQELDDAAERESWSWRDGDWTGREREREWLFLKSFDSDMPALPQWPESSDEQTPPSAFLLALQDGQRLVKLHNALVARSKRQFDLIKSWHSDVGKHYRMAENLRYWIKASELRWEIKLTVPVSDVVNDKDAAAWKAFDEAIFKWSQGIRAELTEEWRQEAAQEKRKPPELKVEVPGAGESRTPGDLPAEQTVA